MIGAKPGSSPPNARLYFIGYQKRPFAMGDFLRLFQIACRGHNDAALALNRFQDHSGRRLVHRLFQGGTVAKRHVAEAL